MKERFFYDVGQILDEVFERANEFKNAFKEGFPPFCGEGEGRFCWGENVDFYPYYTFPPSNIYLTDKRELVLEFALAGYSENDIKLEFQGDYLVLTAKPPVYEDNANYKYFKRRLKFKEIQAQKYHAPERRFARDKVKAVFKNGILKVTIPPCEDLAPAEGVRIEIFKEGD